MRLSLSITIATFMLAGCATNATVPPSQNPSLQAVSPNTAATSQGGAMQRSLDTWLKDEWTPLTTSKAEEDEKAFTLQSFADKWKVYHKNETKINEGKPKEASHIDAVNAMPVIGK